MLGWRERKRPVIGLKRAFMVGAATVFVVGASSLLAEAQTIARSRDVLSVPLSDVHSHQLGTVLNGHAGPVSSVAFNPGGGTLASATENGTV